MIENASNPEISPEINSKNVLNFVKPSKKKRTAVPRKPNPNPPMTNPAETMDQLVKEFNETVKDTTIGSLAFLNRKRCYLISKLKEQSKLKIFAWKQMAIISYNREHAGATFEDCFSLYTRFHHAEMRLQKLAQIIKTLEDDIQELEEAYIKASTGQPGNGGAE